MPIGENYGEKLGELPENPLLPRLPPRIIQKSDTPEIRGYRKNTDFYSETEARIFSSILLRTSAASSVVPSSLYSS